jgi:hypothetical protein
MNITANELKVKGIGAINNALEKSAEVFITSRGKTQCVAMDMKKYHEFCDIKEQLIKRQLQLSSLNDRKFLETEIKDFDNALLDGLDNV